MAHEIIQSLEKIQDQVKQELQNVRTYRALLAVGQAIEEISEVEEIVQSLNGIRGQVVERLHDVREYRALLAVEKSVQDISEVLGILEESARKRTLATTDQAAPPAPVDQQVATEGQAAPPAVTASEPETAAVAQAPSDDVVHQEVGHHAVASAIGQPPSLESGAVSGPAHAQEQSPPPTSEATETAAGSAVYQGDATSQSGENAHAQPVPPTTLTAEPLHEQQQQPPQADETNAETAAHEGGTAEPEDVGIAKVA